MKSYSDFYIFLLKVHIFIKGSEKFSKNFFKKGFFGGFLEKNLKGILARIPGEIFGGIFGGISSGFTRSMSGKNLQDKPCEISRGIHEANFLEVSLEKSFHESLEESLEKFLAELWRYEYSPIGSGLKI